MTHSNDIDEIARKIIIELQKNGRREYTDIAGQLGISLSTVSRRIDNLLNSGIIQITAVPDLAKLGYKFSALIGLDVDVSKIDSVCTSLAALRNVTFVVETFGRFDVFINSYFASMEGMATFVKEVISRIEGVRQVETFYIAGTRKRTLGRIEDTEKYLSA
ncbi:MAG: Lrp/AsnC family transcriptional regulator [Dehalococcoidales bacterium]|nr:Lrp/AsnC family transcriptional regulator [Dehalococcoidales bacterium]